MNTTNSSSQTEATIASEQATAPHSTSGNEEALLKKKEKLQLNVSTDDFYLHNPKIFKNPGKHSLVMIWDRYEWLLG